MNKMNSTRDLAGQVLASVNLTRAKNGPGSSHLQVTDMCRVITLAKDLGGMDSIDEIKEVQKILTDIEEENRAIDRVKSACQTGGWLNAKVKQVDFDQYQQALDIEISELKSALEEAQALAGGMKTEAGCLNLRLAQIVLPLREALSSEVGIQDQQAWRAVEKVLEDNGLLTGSSNFSSVPWSDRSRRGRSDPEEGRVSVKRQSMTATEGGREGAT